MTLRSILDAAIDVTEHRLNPLGSHLDGFLAATNTTEKLQRFCELVNITQPISRRELIRIFQNTIADIDKQLNQQLNVILHHKKLQALEASWRGLHSLVVESNIEGVKIKLLDVSWQQLAKDFDRAIEFDQTQMFQKIYNNEFGMAGGEPFGVILGDYSIQHRPDDTATIRDISQVAAAAFAPFIASADPALFGLDDFAALGLPINVQTIFTQQEYASWNAFRATEDARFVGLTLPKVLMRLPYEDNVFRRDSFCFEEEVSDPSNQAYLWGNACYAFGITLIHSFEHNGWFTDIRGCPASNIRGGKVDNLPVPSFNTDMPNVALKFSTDVLITDYTEKVLSEIGFIPLCHSKDTRQAVFFSNPSVKHAEHYESNIAEINAKMSAMLQYILCASRFAHYIKVIGREKIGTFFTAEECENYLHQWLLSYCTASSNVSDEQLAKYPLAESNVEVKDIPGKPGVYACTIHLKPHMQQDQMVSGLKLVTKIAEISV